MSRSRFPTVTRAFVLPVVAALGGAGRGFRRSLIAGERRDPDAQRTRQAERLRDLLRHAACAPFHRERLAAAGCDPDDLRIPADLARLPLLEKSDLTDTPIADLLTRRARWRHTVRTSGTSGRPVTLHADLAWWARSLVRRGVLFARHGLRYGDREGRCWGRAAGAAAPSLKDRLGSRRVFQFMGMDEAELAAEADALRRFAPAYLYGYPSLVRRAAAVWRDLDLPPLGLDGVVLTGERVAPADQAAIAETFGCPVRREYGCSETDIIAFDCEHGNLHVAADHLVLEVVEEENGIGECVVTDLDNTLMPLIRYRLGDRIRLDVRPCPCGRTTPVIASIEGRTGEARYLYLPDGRRVHTVLFAYLFEDLADGGLPVRQFKVRQTALDRLEVRLDCGPLDAPADLDATVTDAIRERVGYPVHVDLIRGPLDHAPGTKWNYFDPLPSELRPGD